MRYVVLNSLLLVVACGSNAGVEGAGGAKTTCLDAERNETSECALTPEGGLCELASNPSCAKLRSFEVSNPAADGPCLRMVMDNECDDFVYAMTCLEFLEGDSHGWQCWSSSTLPGGELDVGQCNATGKWRHWTSLTTGELDVVEGSCDPEAE